MATVRDVTISLLKNLGITRIFGNPGSTELPLFRDFPEDFEYVLALQEASAVGMADGFAQASRNAAFVNLHSSAGTGHALGNVFTAYKNQTPLIITAGQQARSILPFEPFLFAERASEFPQPFVKWSIEPARAADVPRAIERGYQIAMTPPRGPVFISIPVDDWDQPGEPIEHRQLFCNQPGDQAALQTVAAELQAARNPLLVLGAGVGRDEGYSAAVALAEQQNLPVWVAPFASRNVFPEDHPLFQGFLSASRQMIAETLTPHDLVLVVGGALNLYHTESDGPHLPPDTHVWLIDDNPKLISWAPATNGIVANNRLALEQLLGSTKTTSRPTPNRRTPKSVVPGDTLTESWAINRISELRPDNMIVVEEAPSSRDGVHDFLPIVRPDGFFTTASGGLGYSIPAAVGVAMARPEEKVVALIGDGSAMYSIQALFTAATMNVPVSFLILNNRRYEALRSFGRHFNLGEVHGTDLEGLDFVSLAKGHGMPGRRASTSQELDEALAWSFAEPGPTLVEIMI